MTLDKSKIAIVQFYTNNVIYGTLSEDINRKYCQEQGYLYVVEKDTDKIISTLNGRSPTWYKPKFILDVFNSYDVDYILFLDIDAVVVDFEQQIESFVDDNFDIVFTEDYSTHSLMNAGVFLIKKTDWTVEFLKLWWDSAEWAVPILIPDLTVSPNNKFTVGYFKTGLWHDQSCLTVLYKLDSSTRDKIKIISHNKLNWKEPIGFENFIYHGFAYGYKKFRRIDEIHKKVFKKKVLFLVMTCKIRMSDKENVKMARPDLTRKVDCITTWVPDALREGHDVLFFQGSSPTTYYNPESKTLHTTDLEECEEVGIPSPPFKKLQNACRWALDNLDFDVAYHIQDDNYVNMHEFSKLSMCYDFMSNCGSGGSGFILSKKAMEAIASYNNTDRVYHDLAIMGAIEENKSLTVGRLPMCAPFYIPGELYMSVHYVPGPRMHYLHYVTKYYQENGHTNRKIILGGPLRSDEKNLIISYEQDADRKTPRWYDFIMDSNGWEYHDGYSSSHIFPNHPISDFLQNWPYAPNATKYFVVNTTTMLKRYTESDLDAILAKCEESLINKDNLLLLSEATAPVLNKDGWVLDNNLKRLLRLNFEALEQCNFYRKLSAEFEEL